MTSLAEANVVLVYSVICKMYSITPGKLCDTIWIQWWHDRPHSLLYNPWVKKTGHPTLVHNFAKCWPFLKFFFHCL